MIKNKHHREIQKLFRQHQNHIPNNAWVRKYLGTDKTLYALKTADKVKLFRNYIRRQNLDPPALDDLILSLSRASSFEEVSSLGSLLNLFPQYRRNISLELVDKLLDSLNGWAETDSLSATAFTDLDLLGRWPEWKKFLSRLNRDKNIHKRRASLVFLCRPVGRSPDPRLSLLAFQNTTRLMTEKEILITKAVSWILRQLIGHHGPEVTEYLNKYVLDLPKIALRETRNKLTTGRKTPRP